MTCQKFSSVRRGLAVASVALAGALGAALPSFAHHGQRAEHSAWYGVLAQVDECELYSVTVNVQRSRRAACEAGRLGEQQQYAEADRPRSSFQEERNAVRAERSAQMQDADRRTAAESRTYPASAGAENAARTPADRQIAESRRAEPTLSEGRADAPRNPRAPADRSARDNRTADYTVREGDTLWDIAEAELGDGERYREIVEANASVLEDPNLIFPGERLEIPSRQG